MYLLCWLKRTNNDIPNPDLTEKNAKAGHTGLMAGLLLPSHIYTHACICMYVCGYESF